MNEFEKYRALAIWMERLANSTIEGISVTKWDDFCSSVNGALVEANAESRREEVTADILNGIAGLLSGKAQVWVGQIPVQVRWNMEQPTFAKSPTDAT